MKSYTITSFGSKYVIEADAVVLDKTGRVHVWADGVIIATFPTGCSVHETDRCVEVKPEGTNYLDDNKNPWRSIL